MSDKRIFSNDSSLFKGKANYIKHNNYPKIVKLVKSSSHQTLPPTVLNPQPYIANNHFNPELQRHSRHTPQLMEVLHIDPVPSQRYHHYFHLNTPQEQPQYNYLTRSHSYDGHTRSLANFPLRRNNNYNYIYNSSLYNYDESNIRHINTDVDSATKWNESSINPYRNMEHYQDTSRSRNGRGVQHSVSSSKEKIEFPYLMSREYDAKLINQFEDDSGKTLRVVKPMGGRSRVVHTKYINPDEYTNINIVEPSKNRPQPVSPQPPPIEEEIKVEQPEEEEKELEPEKKFATVSTQTRKEKNVTYRENKAFEIRRNLLKVSKKNES